MEKILVFPRSFNRKLEATGFKKDCQSGSLACSLCWRVFASSLDTCWQFSACSSIDLEQRCMSCSVNYYEIASTKAQEGQLFQGARSVKGEVTA